MAVFIYFYHSKEWEHTDVVTVAWFFFLPFYRAMICLYAVHSLPLYNVSHTEVDPSDVNPLL